MRDWQQKRLSEVVELQRGHDLPTSERRDGPVPIIGSFGVTGYHDRARYAGPGVGIGRSGASIGVATFVADDYWPLNTCLFVRDFKGNDPRWVYRALERIDFAAFNSGSAQPSLNRNFLRSIPVDVPPILEQQAIAEVLGALDDKIAANTALAVTTEAWAVTELSQAPGRARLSDLAVLLKKQVDPHSLSVAFVDHYSLPAFDTRTLPAQEASDTIKSSKFIFSEPVVLLSKLNPRFPRVWRAAPRQTINALASTEFMVLRPTDTSPALLWAALSQASFSSAMDARVAGTSGSHQRVKPGDALALEMLDPRSVPVPVARGIEAALAAADSHRWENRTLAATRDALLPQLMSGKLRVRDAEHIASKVGA